MLLGRGDRGIAEEGAEIETKVGESWTSEVEAELVGQLRIRVHVIDISYESPCIGL